ncbi:hypothetical protein SAMN06297251_101167 [Fulvimarina manganoxydans]|uniref:Transmembrane protein n=1 Tax=Fulvimarina manganoxydans TaxID=937218 RepID=A0A1W1YCJ2_9HYPH|nr:hypothetical protein [Fulvimarina manganoxydans]SMC33877.1 hypothetical protein SAMN06297251_101167 [Fulvimarina manganoxydans]
MTEFEIRNDKDDDLDLARPVAEFRNALLRASLLFGVVALALGLVILPSTGERSGSLFASNRPNIDMMTTGSIEPNGSGTYRVQRSVLQPSGGACFVFQDGGRRGSC